MKKLNLFIVLFFILSLKTFAKQQDAINIDTAEALNKQNLINYLVKTKVKFTEIVYVQILLETGNLKSKLCIKHNNLFGMRMPKKRRTTAIGVTKSGYSKYTNWKQSVDDYVLFQQKVFKNNDWSKAKYLTFLNHRYSQTKGCAKRLLNRLRDNNLISQS